MILKEIIHSPERGEERTGEETLKREGGNKKRDKD